MLYPTNLHDVSVVDADFPAFVTEDGDMILYCSDGRVFWKNELVEFANPTFNIEGVEYVFDALGKAKDENVDVLVYLEGFFELERMKDFVLPQYWSIK